MNGPSAAWLAPFQQLVDQSPSPANPYPNLANVPPMPAAAPPPEAAPAPPPAGDPDAWKNFLPPSLPPIQTTPLPEPSAGNPIDVPADASRDAALRQLAGGGPQKSVFDFGQAPTPGPVAPPPGTMQGLGAPPPPGAPTQTPAPSAPTPSGAAAPPMPDDVQFRPVGGGTSPAREVPLRGPKQNALLERSFEHEQVAADRIQARSEEAAQHEAAMYDRFADDALNRQAAYERVAARRQAEMQQLRDDYSNTIQQLGSMKLDTNRAWANASTPDKIGAIALSFLGGVFSGGGENKVQAAIDRKMKEDVETQMFDYKKGLDLAKGQQTAFGMAMDQYGNEDAAYHASLAAAQQFTAAKMGSLAAQWKGTDSANRADELRAKYAMLADQNQAEGFKYLQPTVAQPKYQMVIRGQALPGLVSQDKAQEFTLKHGVEPAERTDEALLKGGVEATLQSQKIAAENKATNGLGKAGAEKLALEAKQAEQERNANLHAINMAKADLPAIVEGGAIGNAAAQHLPAFVPGATTAIKNANKREAYNRRAMLAVAGAYKLSTDATEPKRKEMLDHFVAPYEIKPTDNEEIARSKMDALEKLLTESAGAKGAVETPQARMPSSFKRVK